MYLDLRKNVIGSKERKKNIKCLNFTAKQLNYYLRVKVNIADVCLHLAGETADK